MATTKSMQPIAATQIPEPPIARFLFADTRMAWFWLIIRFYVGYEWFTARWEKLTGHSISFGSFGAVSTGGPWVLSAHDGAAIKGFVAGAVAKTTGANPAVQGWYATFLQNVVLPHAAVFAYVITFGEMLVGIALILGLLTGIAAFFGVFMNLNYILAGAVSTNPILGFLALFLILAWRIGGYYSLDHYALPLLGTPWTGRLTDKPMPETTPVQSPPLADTTESMSEKPIMPRTPVANKGD
jgi:thiosulfate dehydrogenase [quinone] large subunit